MAALTFIKQINGRKALEYATFIGLIAGMIYVALSILGNNSQASTNPFDDNGQSVAMSHPDHPENPRAAEAGKSARVTSGANTTNGSIDGGDFQARRLAAVLSIMALGVLAWFYLYVNGRKIGAPDDAAFMGSTEVQRDAIFKKRQQIFQALSEHVRDVFSGDIQVRHLMSRRLTTVLTTTPASEVQTTMKTNRLRHVLVCNDENKLVGIISIKDVNKGKTAASMMTANPHTVEPESLLGPTITLLIHNRISCLPVVRNGTLLGILTTTDVLMGMQGVVQILRKLVAEGEIVVPNEPKFGSQAISHAVAQCECDSYSPRPTPQ